MSVLQLRQHMVTSGASSSYSATNDTSFYLMCNGVGYEISAFSVFPRAWLHGKKIRYTRTISGSSGTAHTFIYGEVMDGAYDRSSSTHFPDGAQRANIGNGRLLLIEQVDAAATTLTRTTGVLNLSGGSQDNVSIFWRIYSGYWGYTWGITVTSCEILDASDNVLLTLNIDSYTAESSVSGQNYGTMGSFPSILSPVSNAIEGRYGLYSDHLEQGLVGGYHLLAVVLASLTGVYGLVIEQALIGRYGNAAAVETALVGRYGSASQVAAALVGRYGDYLQVLAALEGRYHLMHSVLSGLDGRYSIGGSVVLTALDGRYDLQERNNILAALTGFYSLLPDATMQSVVCPVLIGGVAIKWSAVQWTVSESSYLIEASISLRDGAEFGSISKNDQVTITWQGTVYTLFVATKLRSRSVSGSPGAVEYGVDYTIVARSLTAGLDEPYALPTTLSWPAATMASAIAAQLIASLADIISLDWRLEDWLQPGGTFFLTDETPLAGLRKLAGIVGGILQTSSGNALIIRKADPVAPKDWPTTVPAWTIEDSGLFSDSESEDISSLYNVITVTNQSATDSTIRFETEEIDRYRHKVKGFRVPWVDFTLATSGGEWVTIENMGIVEEQIVETVEFIDGASSTTNPVYSSVAAVWLRSQLGAITSAEDGSLTSEVTGCSLAEITYTTKYHAWIGRSDRDEEVQFYAVELP